MKQMVILRRIGLWAVDDSVAEALGLIISTAKKKQTLCEKKNAIVVLFGLSNNILISI